LDKGTWTFGQAANASGAASGLVSFLLGQNPIPDPGNAAAAAIGTATIRVNNAGGGARNSGLQQAQLLYGDPFVHATRTNISLFLQDDYRITPRLTLNAGLRWDYSTPLRSKGQVLGNFDPTTSTGVLQEGVNIDSIYNSNKKNFGPRLGFA